MLSKRRQNRHRKLFELYDGTRTRRIDPIQAHIEFQLHPDFNWNDGELLGAGDPETTKRYARAACDVFGLTQWDDLTQTGMTVPELIATLESFLEFCEDLKKNTSVGPILPQPTDLRSSQHAEADPPRTTS